MHVSRPLRMSHFICDVHALLLLCWHTNEACHILMSHVTYEWGGGVTSWVRRRDITWALTCCVLCKTFIICVYKVAKTQRMAYLYRLFFVKEPYNSWLFCRKTICNLRHPMSLRHPVLRRCTRKRDRANERVCECVLVRMRVYVCVCVCARVHVRVCVRGCACVCICVFVYVCECVNIFVCVCEGMCVYECVSVCVCACVCVYVCASTCLDVFLLTAYQRRCRPPCSCAFVGGCIHTHAYTHMYIYICIKGDLHTFIYTYIYIYIHIYMYLYIYVYVYVCTYAYTHKHNYMYM